MSKRWILDIAKLAGAVLICQAAGMLGGLATAPNIASWYAYIEKPPFTPPDWIFSPVWITLYILMGDRGLVGVAAGVDHRGRKTGHGLLPGATRLKRALVFRFLRAALAALRAGGDHPAVGIHRTYYRLLLPRLETGRATTHSLHYLGEFRRGAQRRHLRVELGGRNYGR